MKPITGPGVPDFSWGMLLGGYFLQTDASAMDLLNGFVDHAFATALAVPDGGTTLLLLGLGFTSVVLIKRQMRNRRKSGKGP